MRVGTSSDSDSPQHAVEDHPHACGDKRRNSLTSPSTLGSSPCVWGQVIFISALDQNRRIIPMRVGTRSAFNRAFAKTWDHPHACGDKGYKLFTSAVTPGSSPCVWGQEHRRLQHPSLARIIPMRVGTRQALTRRPAYN